MVGATEVAASARCPLIRSARALSGLRPRESAVNSAAVNQESVGRSADVAIRDEVKDRNDIILSLCANDVSEVSPSVANGNQVLDLTVRSGD